MNKKFLAALFVMTGLTALGQSPQPEVKRVPISLYTDLLDYHGTPENKLDKEMLMFSDLGAWFAFSLPEAAGQLGFSGPFLMTQDNGIWSSDRLVDLRLLNSNGEAFDFEQQETRSQLGSLEILSTAAALEVKQQLFFTDAHTAAVRVSLKNTSGKTLDIQPVFQGKLWLENLLFEKKEDFLQLNSELNNSVGLITLPEYRSSRFLVSKDRYKMEMPAVSLKAGEIKEFVYTLSFFFPAGQQQIEEQVAIAENAAENFPSLFQVRNEEKQQLLSHLQEKILSPWTAPEYRQLAGKLVLTLQNNWRSPAGSLKRGGLFPSYHNKWFQGFWAWDSWKHAAALAHYQPELAKDQMLALFDYITEEGFVPDVIYRDNLLEENNYRDTKPPLSAWAAWEIYQADGDTEFIREIYPLIKKQHQWWYTDRDHDGDGLSEYGSTDGTLVAAKWESGMDNAVRFDSTAIVKNHEGAYSLDQESVDLNSYLYVEKKYLGQMAEMLGLTEEKDQFRQAADSLAEKIRQQFFDEESGYFYDTDLQGKEFRKVKGPEGWIPLWAGIATPEQAEKVKAKMMDPKLFNVAVPLQTLNASHSKFEPDGGYWRGPTWIDQAYFGIMGLKNYGFQKEAEALAQNLFQNAEGVMQPGKAIRENYNPITGEGLEAVNFSWSAAHFLLILLNK